MAGTFTPYTTVAEYFGAKPTWIPNELDVQRIQSYQTYEELYWNVPDVLKVSLRGSNELPIYVPSARTIIDTTNRYTAPAFAVTTRDSVSGQDSPDAQALRNTLREWMKRERFKAKFNGAKRYGLIHGDWIWHITADESKPEGSRVSITTLDPAMYFPITDEEDVDRIVGVHLVELISTDDGPRIRRLTYRKVPRSDGLNTITVEDGIFEVDKWGGPDAHAQTVLQQPTPLPDNITQIPVYHTRNMEEPGNPYGSSEVRGLERLIGALSQTLSDEDLALALLGIGLYATDASEPIDPVTRKSVPWQLGPGRVVHHDGTRFDKIPGAGNLAESYGEHWNRVQEVIKQASSTPDIAIGQVDVQVASSGVALALQLSPMLAKAGEKNDLILGTHDQMFYDLTRMWFAAYEGVDSEDVTTECTVGDAVPVDRQQRFTELNDMLDRGVIDTNYYRTEARKLGYVFPDDIGTSASAEFQARNADQFGQRVDAELTDGAA